ncbi:MAG: type II secretion system major pseudopilin GspG [Planctomycetota bacterium]|jgi:general secretion pathway protein G
MNRRNAARRGRRGFTFAEIMVVIILLSLIAVFVVPRTFKSLGKAKTKIARAKMGIIESAIQQFYVDCERYPMDLSELLEAPGDVEEKWSGRYCKPSDLMDPWDNPYLYEPEGFVNVGSYDLISLGADGQEGGDADNADIYNE